jgi:uncharacterized protein (TIGR04255 family)
MNTSLKVDQQPFKPRIEDSAPFPDSERVVYGRNPLELVICQLRFPSVLKISAEPPAAFQERVRKEFPLYREVPTVGFGVTLPSEMSDVVNRMLPIPTTRAYEFASGDDAWKVTLTQESLALTCTNYTRWEGFRQHLRTLLEVLLDLYQPPFFTRIGLRYRDVINRSELGLAGVSWSELLSKELGGVFHSAVASSIEGLAYQLVLTLQSDAAKVTIQHGLGQKGEEICYIVDSDFYVTNRTETNDAIDILNYFNRQSGRLFRWSIAERLHRALEPRSV